MNKEERFKKAIEKGYYYDELLGLIYNKINKPITGKDSLGYIKFHIYNKEYKGFHIYGHQFAWYFKHNEIVSCIDHINRNKSDNRISNLRAVSQKENMWNINVKKGYTFFKRDNNWKAQININKKHTHLGYFKTEVEARQAYLDAVLKYRGI